MTRNNFPEEWLYGWDDTLGIVSVAADRAGRATLWRRVDRQVICERDEYPPFLYARTLADITGLASSNAIRYQKLNGGGMGDYRYLIYARHFRTLERTILPAASRRLGKSVTSLSQLPDYYALGPVEQYLICTGRTYYKGMQYADLRRLQLDLSTTNLNPNKGHIFLAAVRDGAGFEAVLEAANPEDEPRLIADLCQLIRARDPDIIEGYNLFGFDLPYLAARARRLNVPLLLGRGDKGAELQHHTEGAGYGHLRSRYSVRGREMIDILTAVWHHNITARDMPGYGLKTTARYFGVASERRTYVSGHHVYDRYAAHPERVKEYALDDLRDVDRLSKLLMGSAFALATMTPRPYERIANAGPAMGILEPMLVRAYFRAEVALPRSTDLDNPDLPMHEGGVSYLLAGGVARRIVKADVASMYPSIMREYGIGPSCDRLGVLRGLSERLLELRLERKARARAATNGSPAAMLHKSEAQAMKIVINAAYGYMAAGGFALFADVAAADRITAYSRTILDQVIAALRQRGMTLLEADTDGVYFAVPDGYTEQDERHVVAEVGAKLPSGIRLEFEGRYQAMLSHERKNYALLTYGGKLIVKGVGMGNSRSEPFAVRFLRDALLYLLCGDVPSLVSLYRATIDALRQHKLPTSDIATRARLTKSFAEYRLTRRRLHEAPYEALLNAGRTTWQRGEKVRYYYAARGRVVWLPYAPDDMDGAEGTGGIPDDTSAVNPLHIDRRDYDANHYIRLLHTSYLSRLRKAFSEEDFTRLFRKNQQRGLFDVPTSAMQLAWIEVAPSAHIALIATMLYNLSN